MYLESVGEIVASRRLEIASEDGTKEVLVQFGKPQPFSDSSGFYCPVQVLGTGDEKVRYAGGFDEVQALQLAMRMAGVLLETLDPKTRAKLRWNNSHDLGLPVS